MTLRSELRELCHWDCAQRTFGTNERPCVYCEAGAEIDALTTNVARLRGAIQKGIDDAIHLAIDRKPFPTFWLNSLRRALAETAPKGTA